jgi:two-component system sensor histidine kinase/response regulator
MNPKPLSVLLVDDDEDDYLIVRGLLAKITNPKIKLDWISDPHAAIDIIEKNNHDIYLIDYRLGPMSGLDLLANFDLPSRDQPFIILTGAGDSRLEERAMLIGVADYLVKGSFDVELLSRVLRYSLQRKRTELQRLQHLQEVNKSKDEFISLASHQLRTPATAVKQYIGMLLEGYAGALSETQQSYLQSAYSSNERQLKIVDDILRVAQIDLKKLRMRPEMADMTSWISELAKDMEPILVDRDQKLVFESPEKPINARIDKLYLGMALTNLLDNASKYSNHETTVSVSLSCDDKGLLQINIKDQGVGISADDFDKLFVKFSRIPNPVSVLVGGTGLGLYWSNEIVHLHNGKIEVSSELNVGTTFTISLPYN